jgi:predicted transcriptional regulator
MTKRSISQLSRRERQIMEVIYRLGEASVSDVQEGIADAPGYSSVRTLLGVLEGKGYVRHKKRGRAYVYAPTVSLEKARQSALSNVVQNFFEGSVENVVAALMSLSESQLSPEDLERLEQLIKEKRKETGK